MIKTSSVTVVFILFACELITLLIATACIEFQPFLQYGKGPSTSQFWSTRTDDLAQCARACVRRKPCMSITFDTGSNMCELNKLRVNETKPRYGSTLMYSEFRSWPPSVDKDCFPRPCSESQVCVPGQLADGISSDCRHACMDVAAMSVCPIPKALNGSRTVSSVNTVTCPPFHVGGGSATCQANLEWSSEVTPCKKCKDPQVVPEAELQWNGSAHVYVCNSLLGLVPLRGKDPVVTCDSTTLEWDTTDFECYGARLVEGSHPATGFLKIFAHGEWAYIKHDSKFYWDEVSAVCQDINPAYTHGGSYHRDYMDIHRNDAKQIHIDSKPCSGGEISLANCQLPFPDSSNDNKQLGVTCYTESPEPPAFDVYLQAADGSNSSVSDKTVMSGRLIVRFNNTVYTVCDENWDDIDTEVVCRTINPNWQRNDDDKCSSCSQFGDSDLPVLTTKMKCRDENENLFQCGNQGLWTSDLLNCQDKVTIECET